MPSRFRVFSSIFLFALLVCAQLLAQSNSASSAQHRARALKPSAHSLGGLQTPALTFAPVASYLSDGNGANAVAIADVNNDGKADLVVTNWCAYSSCTTPGTNVGVLLGNGDGTFQTAVAYASGGLFADSIAVADVNGDGKPDLIVANCGSSSQVNCVSNSNSGDVAVLLGNGDGTFRTAVLYSLGASGATSVAVADVNGDGRPDLIVATGSSTEGLVGVLLGNGDGTFGAVATYSSSGLSPLALAVADLNGDGKPDVVVTNQWADGTFTNSDVSVLLNDGTGKFPTAVPYGTGGFFPDSVAIADVNRDGKPDLVVANSSVGINGGLGNVGVLLGKGDGTFQPEVPYASGGYGAAAVAVEDVNGDGKLDVVVGNCSGSSSDCTGTAGNVGVLLGKGDGTFQTAVTYTSGSTYPFAVAVGDVNGDGRPDILAANCSTVNCGQGAGYAGVLINQTTPWLVYASLARQVDYFGKGTADFTVWRPSTRDWYSTDGSSNSLFKQWGLPGDVPVIGDYDGDGKTDLAVWRPSNGTWYIIESSAGTIVQKQWGLPGDVPVPGDYDGDGKTDLAVWRPSNGTWYIIQSTNNEMVQRQWGLRGDVPVPADYDGDGKTDFAVWRPSNEVWYIIQSSTGKIIQRQWGLKGDKPAPADFDGDGKTDLAVWRPSNGTWYIIESSTGTIVQKQWGVPGDIPVPRDYDGDLKADFAVWRPSNGTWYVIKSSNNQIIQKQYGLTNDVPVNRPVGQ